ncbi:UAA transporter [Roridomyces roridus]|uniref:UDP-galactose transporter homolog 1 n=1 Tax=Roridomyces roridus TaxID=1738132 RepID=A0AAD7CB60_9AGAR|nr:UAA transporter [Roridomyces roridus]
MALLRLALCVAGVYSMFLVWAISQERLSVPFESIDGTPTTKFKSAIFISTLQSILSSISAFVYILLRRKPGETFMQSIGLEHAPEPTANGQANGHSAKHPNKTDTRFSRSALLGRYLQCALFITTAAPFGFAALSYISYPAMVLGKSCKLVPVMLMNVLLYRRRFAPHKYLVVFMVTAGITIFMGLGPAKPSKAKSDAPPHAELIGLAYLLINLALDGLTNSTQDEIFARHRVTGQQMMLWLNIFCTALTMLLMALPLPSIPVLRPSPAGIELQSALEFIRTHPGIKMPLLQFAFTGALGQLFIFETLQHFGSLTLVTITLTRKVFTMLLSVVLYNHKLTSGQWLGAGVVFAGISVEAFVKRKDVHAKKVVQEKEVAKIKAL